MKKILFGFLLVCLSTYSFSAAPMWSNQGTTDTSNVYLDINNLKILNEKKGIIESWVKFEDTPTPSNDKDPAYNVVKYIFNCQTKESTRVFNAIYSHNDGLIASSVLDERTSPIVPGSVGEDLSSHACYMALWMKGLREKQEKAR